MPRKKKIVELPKALREAIIEMQLPDGETSASEVLLAENRMLMDQLAAQRQIADTSNRDAIITGLMEMLKTQQTLTADILAVLVRDKYRD